MGKLLKVLGILTDFLILGRSKGLWHRQLSPTDSLRDLGRRTDRPVR